MSFEIEFSGSNADRRNLAQMSASSSMSATTVLDNWDGTIGPPPFGIYQKPSGFASAYAGASDFQMYVASGSSGSTSSSGSSWTLSSNGSTGSWGGVIRVLESGSYNFSFNISQTGGGTLFLAQVNSSNQTVIEIYGTGSTVTRNTNYTLSAGTTYVLQKTSSGSITFNSFLITGGSAPVSITTSTLTQGASPVGGTPITTQVQTLQNGSNAITSPSQKFGLRVKDGATQKLEASYNPSADNNQDSYIDATDAKIITADTTSLSVESFGTGAPEYIERGSSIEVKDMSHLTEN